jgi:hypothetical protein
MIFMPAIPGCRSVLLGRRLFLKIYGDPVLMAASLLRLASIMSSCSPELDTSTVSPQMRASSLTLI